MDMWVADELLSFGVLWIKLLCVFVSGLSQVFISLGEIPGGRIVESYGKCMCNFWGNCETFPKYLCHFAFWQAMYLKGFSCSISLSMLDIVIVFHFNHFGGCAVDFIVVLLCIPPDDVKHYFIHVRDICISLGSVCSDILPIFYLGYLIIEP